MITPKKKKIKFSFKIPHFLGVNDETNNNNNNLTSEKTASLVCEVINNVKHIYNFHINPEKEEILQQEKMKRERRKEKRRRKKEREEAREKQRQLRLLKIEEVIVFFFVFLDFNNLYF